MSQRQAVTRTMATRYQRASKAEKGALLDELCATTLWHRAHARKALGQALRPDGGASAPAAAVDLRAGGGGRVEVVLGGAGRADG